MAMFLHGHFFCRSALRLRTVGKRLRTVGERRQASNEAW